VKRMKGVSTEPMALLSRYEPLTLRFGRQILHKGVTIRRRRAGVRLLFAKIPRPSIHHLHRHQLRIVRFDRRLWLRIGNDVTVLSPLSVVKIAKRVAGVDKKGRGPVGPILFLKERYERAGHPPEIREAVIPSNVAAVPLRWRGLQSRDDTPSQKAIGEEASRGREAPLVHSNMDRLRRQEVQKSAGHYLKPAPLHYKKPSALPIPAAREAAQRAERIETGEAREVRSERLDEKLRRELLLRKRAEIESIGEKVYTLVMQKWEKERRRRGVLYE